MSDRSQRRWAWLGAPLVRAVVVAGVVAVAGWAPGDGSPALPSLAHPGGWPGWWTRVGPIYGAFGILRALVVVLGGYLLVLVILAMLGTVAGAASFCSSLASSLSGWMWSVLRAVSTPGLRRLALVSASLATAGAVAASGTVVAGAAGMAGGGPGPAAVGGSAVGDGSAGRGPGPAAVGGSAVGGSAGSGSAGSGSAGGRSAGDGESPPVLRMVQPSHPPTLRPVVPGPGVVVRGRGGPAPVGSRASLPSASGTSPPAEVPVSPDPAPAGANPAPGAATGVPPTTTDPAVTPVPASPVAASPVPATWTVSPGDSLWSIAASSLSAAWGSTPDPSTMARYWWRLVEVNRATLPDPANADLIFPGDSIVVPEPPPRP
ncbi:MAG: hypothetical protein ACRDY0_09140 [Acidimicrobiales bacterium]